MIQRLTHGAARWEVVKFTENRDVFEAGHVKACETGPENPKGKSGSWSQESGS